MLIQALLVGFAFILTLVFTPVCRNLCLRAGWVDKPDSRKLHRKPIPRSGGVAIMLGYAVALIVVRLAPVGVSRPSTGLRFPSGRCSLPYWLRSGRVSWTTFSTSGPG